MNNIEDKLKQLEGTVIKSIDTSTNLSNLLNARLSLLNSKVILLHKRLYQLYAVLVSAVAIIITLSIVTLYLINELWKI